MGERMMLPSFKEITEISVNRFAESPLGRQLESRELDGLQNSKGCSLDTATSDVSMAYYDDNGERFRAEDGSLLPNRAYALSAITYKTDDAGEVYSIGEKLQPSTTYELNGNRYTTDDLGRIIQCEAKPVRSPEAPRDNEAQLQAGGSSRRPQDQGGHIVGRDLNGDGGNGNLVAMDSKINQSDYKRMENEVKSLLDEGKDVTLKSEISYPDDSERPDQMKVTIASDAGNIVYKFDNNLDGCLQKEIPEEGRAIVRDRLEETNGDISSIKKEYDAVNNLIQTTVYITYTENGTNYRTSVVI